MTINNMWFLKKTVKRKMDFHNPHADAYNIAKCRQILVEYVAQNPHPLYPVLTPR
jgi:aminoglycoside N3'-acetyltransferase